MAGGLRNYETVRARAAGGAAAPYASPALPQLPARCACVRELRRAVPCSARAQVLLILLVGLGISYLKPEYSACGLNHEKSFVIWSKRVVMPHHPLGPAAVHVHDGEIVGVVPIDHPPHFSINYGDLVISPARAHLAAPLCARHRSPRRSLQQSNSRMKHRSVPACPQLTSNVRIAVRLMPAGLLA